MSIISYAQNFEDVMLWRALGHIERGFYIDIGAQDPTIDSVSRAFHEHGWHGIHVEPTPHYAELLRQQRPGDMVIQAAVGNGPALSRFYEIPYTGISTADAGIASQHRERGFDVQEIIVNFVALSAIFETCAEEIHWLKIDVEGFEQQLLSSWGESAARPWIVVVESTLPLTQTETHENWESIIIGYGYSLVYFDGLNRYYVSDAHAELKAAFASPPNVFDGFTLNGTASAPFHRLIEERCQEKISETVTQSEQQKTVLQHEAKLLSASLSSLTETYAGQQQNWQQAEQALSEQSRQAKQELEALHHTQAQRELEVAAQILAIQQQAEQQKAELVRSQHQQERALHEQHTEQEQALHHKVQVLHQQLGWLQQEHLTREQTLHEQTSQARQEIENILRTQVQREQDVATQLSAIHQQAKREHAELIEQERKSHHLFAEREEKLKQQLQDRQEDLHNLQKDRARREQEMGEQLLALQRQAAHEMVEQAQKHLEQASALRQLHAEREQSLIQERQAGQQDLRRFEQDRVQREKDHAEQISQTHQELEGLLRNQVQREQEINAQLLTIRQQAQQEMLEHTRLLNACTELEARLQAEMQSGQQAHTHLRDLLVEVQHNLDLAHASLSWRMTAPLRKIAGLFGLRTDKASTPINLCDRTTPEESVPGSTKEASSSASDTLPNEQGSVIAAVALAASTTASSNSPTCFEKSNSANAENYSIAAHPKPLAPITSKLAYATVTSMPSIASTLPEILAYQDKKFVYCAYQTLLGRDPDCEGLGYYLGRLRMGFPKIEILTQLRNSKEGELHNSKLPKLDWAIQQYQKGQYPLIGWIFRLFSGTDGKGRTELKLRSIANQIYLLGADSFSRIDRIESELSEIRSILMQRATGQPQEKKVALTIPDPKNLKHYPPRARSIYFQFKLARASVSLGDV